MANQMTIRNDAASRITARSLALPVAAVAGSQFLAFTALAQGGSDTVAPSDPDPIFYPESLFVAFVVGVVVGMAAVGVGAKVIKRTG